MDQSQPPPRAIREAFKDEATRQLTQGVRGLLRRSGSTPSPTAVDRKAKALWASVGDPSGPAHHFAVNHDWPTADDHLAVIAKAIETLDEANFDAAREMAAEFTHKWSEYDRLTAVSNWLGYRIDLDNPPLPYLEEHEPERRQRTERHEQSRAMVLTRVYWKLGDRGSKEGSELLHQAWLTAPDDLATDWYNRQAEAQLIATGAVPVESLNLTEDQAEWVVFGDRRLSESLRRVGGDLYKLADRGHTAMMTDPRRKAQLLQQQMPEQMENAIGDPAALDRSDPNQAQAYRNMQKLAGMIVDSWDGIRSPDLDAGIWLPGLNATQATKFTDLQAAVGISRGRGVHIPALGVADGRAAGRGSGIPSPHVGR